VERGVEAGDVGHVRQRLPDAVERRERPRLVDRSERGQRPEIRDDAVVDNRCRAVEVTAVDDPMPDRVDRPEIGDPVGDRAGGERACDGL